MNNTRKGFKFTPTDKDKRIEELEQKLEQTEKDLADYQFNYPSIKELSKENAELHNRCKNCALEISKGKLEDLQKENAELQQIISNLQDANCTSCTTLGGMQLKINKLEKENAELKKLELAHNEFMIEYKNKHNEEICERDMKLAQATKIIKGLLPCCRNYPQENAEKIKQAEQFLKEIEK